MLEVDVINYSERALLLVLFLSMPPIIVAALVGTLVSLLQALTQIQEQTLGFAIKLAAVLVTILATANWLGEELYQYALFIFDKIETLS